MLIAKIKEVIHVPRLAPIIMPRQSSSLMYFDESKEILMAVTPEDDCNMLALIQPNKKLLVLEFVNRSIKLYIFDENIIFKLFLIKSNDNKKILKPEEIYIKEFIINYIFKFQKYAYVKYSIDFMNKEEYNRDIFWRKTWVNNVHL